MAVISMNETTTFRWPFEEDVFAYTDAGIKAMGVWRQKLSDFGEAKGIELLEETGYVADAMIPLGWFYPDTGRLDNRLWCYFAPAVVLADPPPPPETGLESLTMTATELAAEISAGNFRHALHVAVLSIAQNQGHIPHLAYGAPRD